MGINDINPFSDDFDRKRALVAVGTMGASEAGGIRPLVEEGVEQVTGKSVPEAAKALAAGVGGAFTGQQAQVYQPSQNTATFGDPNYNPNAAAALQADAAGFQQGAAMAQGRGIDTSAADAGGQRLALDAQALRDYAAQGPGPSVAEAQLQQARDQNMRQALALAGSSRGNLGTNVALRQAGQQRADAMTQTGGQLAVVRAQEADMWRQRVLDSQKAAADVTATMRTGDLDTLNTMIQNRQTNDALSIALGEQGLTAEQIAQRYAEMDAEQRLAFEQMMGDYFMRAQEVNVQTDAARDAATIAALGGVAEAGLEMVGDVVPG